MFINTFEFMTSVLLVPALIGALWLIIVILYKGDICPGQRGRLHKSVAVIAVLMAIASVLNLWLFPSLALMLWFYSKIQTKKTRVEGPRAALVCAAIWASLVGCLAFNQQLSQHYLWESVVGFVFFVILVTLLGASLAHLLLLRARTRLQAFHRLLPILGVIASFTYLVVWMTLLWSVSVRTPLNVDELLTPLLLAIAGLLTGLIAWNWHLLQRHEIKQPSLWLACVGLASSHLLFMQFLP
jgi:uncharacterized membrane-anchored protein